MLKKGEKGTVIQRDGQTYAIAPHLPCGLVTPEVLRRIADVADRYDVKMLKITGATRFIMIGLTEEQVDPVWEDLGLAPGAAVGLCVRSIRACPGTTHCRVAKQDALGVGLKLDAAYHGKQLPGKFKMAVSGCNLSCAESWVRDIGLIGTKQGWTLIVGGNVGNKPRIGREIASGLSDEEALAAVDKVVERYAGLAKKGERLGRLVERGGLEPFAELFA